MSKFANLDAEQARRDMTDEKVAAAIGMARESFLARKHGKTEFKISEINKVIAVFGGKYEYLFAITSTSKKQDA